LLCHLVQSSRTTTTVAPPPLPKAPPCDDAEGHYIINMGDIVHDRCTSPAADRCPRSSFDRSPDQLLFLSFPADRIVRKLGEGTFGKVVECVDRKSPERKYAVKIIRAVQKYREASKIEIRVLEELKRGDPYNEKCVGRAPAPAQRWPTDAHLRSSSANAST
jgi:dual-specificity kinase